MLASRMRGQDFNARGPPKGDMYSIDESKPRCVSQRSWCVVALFRSPRHRVVLCFPGPSARKPCGGSTANRSSTTPRCVQLEPTRSKLGNIQTVRQPTVRVAAELLMLCCGQALRRMTNSEFADEAITREHQVLAQTMLVAGNDVGASPAKVERQLAHLHCPSSIGY